MNRIQTVLNHVEGPTILDLGAAQHDAENESNADWLHGHLADEFETVVGVDFLPDAVLELNQQGYQFRYADVTDMDLDIHADTVVAGELIEHLANPGLMLENANDHLKDGGKLIITTPNPWAIVHLRRWLTDSIQINDEHCAWYGPVVLKQLLQRYGFAITEITGVGPNHGGLTGVAQFLGSGTFGQTTWVIVAQKQ